MLSVTSLTRLTFGSVVYTSQNTIGVFFEKRLVSRKFLWCFFSPKRLCQIGVDTVANTLIDSTETAGVQFQSHDALVDFTTFIYRVGSPSVPPYRFLFSW